MTPIPTSQGLLICERVIVEEGTGMPSCVGIFTVLDCDEFPVAAPPFYVFSPLTNSVGRCTIKITVTELEDMNVIVEHQSPFQLYDRLQIAFFHLRLTDVEYTAAGRYEYSLYVDADLIAQTTLLIQERF